MTTPGKSPEAGAELRRRAEAIARERTSRTARDEASESPDKLREVLHELRVHQIELEMQNEELRAAQAETEAARGRYFDLYHLAPVGYLSLSELGVILDTNLCAASLLGRSRPELIDRPIFDFIHTEDQDVYYLHRKALLRSGSPEECELRLIRADGSPLWAHLTATAAQRDDGSPIWRVVVADITRRKQAEERNEHLQTQLNRAQRLESVGRLAGGVAHDFNNMLGVILGNVDIALDQPGASGRLAESLEEIRHAAHRSRDLVRQLLGFAGRQPIAPLVLDLNSVVEGMLGMLRRLIGENIALDWNPAPTLWMVRIDPSQIDQILANLCVNARDAITGCGRISVQTSNTRIGAEDAAGDAGQTPGDYVTLAVTDNGRGMDSATLAHIFDPFFTTKAVGKGTGLGLSTVYGIAKQNGGYVTVRSKVGEGTTLEVYLPRSASPEPGTPASSMPEHAAVAARGSETILLVEDEPKMLRTTATLLGRQGYAVLAAGSPGEAMRLSREHPGRIDLLLTDVVMPGMNGRELCRDLRLLRPTLKCLYFSGYPFNEVQGAGPIEGRIHFLQKPSSLNELAAKVREVLAASS